MHILFYIFCFEKIQFKIKLKKIFFFKKTKIILEIFFFFKFAKKKKKKKIRVTQVRFLKSFPLGY